MPLRHPPPYRRAVLRSPDRRAVLRLGAGFSTAALLAACGGGGASDGDAITIVRTSTGVAPAPVAAAQGAPALALVLNLTYLGAQYYGHAARGAGLPDDLVSGIGSAGAVVGAGPARFADPVIAAYAAELANDKRANLAVLRERMGAMAAAQPAIDLSNGVSSAFSVAARAAGIVGAGGAFDAYADDDSFLLGAFFVENIVAAAYRALSPDTRTDAVDANLADSIYHGGLIRALLDDRSATNPALATAVGKAAAMLAGLDGSGSGTLAAVAASPDIPDAAGRPIPFTRTTGQILKTLYLSNAGGGGFLPAGANGVTA